MLVSELRAKINDDWFWVYKFTGKTIVLWVEFGGDKFVVNINQVERIEA